MTRVELDGVTFSLEVKGEDYSVRKHDIDATEFYVDNTSGGLLIAPENTDGPTDYAAVEMSTETAEKLANKILKTVWELESDK